MKRALDMLLSAAALVVLSPVMAMVALSACIVHGRPLLFRQLRPGRDGRPFEMLKFRTMREAFGRDGEPLPDAQRLSRFGQMLRATSLDELPELWNVLKGDMSLVGPRPLLMQYLPLYSAEQMRRHAVRPGLTGWAQVNGRNAVDWQTRFELDLWYVDNRSLWLDFVILMKTVRKVLLREEISAADHATMPLFAGNAAPRHD